MIFLYNLLVAALLPLLPLVLFRTKYRGRTLERLGLQTQHIRDILFTAKSGPVIWLHALSVGEVTSALPLVKAIRENICPARIVFTAATRSGRVLAEKLIKPHADLVLYSPLDITCAVRRYLDAIQPNLFILVETDFWPNWLQQLHKRQVPVMLVNGRISAKSFAAYRRFAFFFQPMFRCFDLLSMQTEHDRRLMIELGNPAERVICLGNLKYEVGRGESCIRLGSVSGDRKDRPYDDTGHVWVCGSTHPGEEELIFAAFKKVGAYLRVCPDNLPLQLIIAPRKIERGSELVKLAHQFGLTADLRSSGTATNSNVLILDTIGELASCYRLARLAFIGGSMVAEGGHNPIEAAVQGVPVLFGPHMDDFAEIASDLLRCGGAHIVTAENLAEIASRILADTALHAAMSQAAQTLVEQQRGSVARHVQVVRELMGKKK
ncbi:MAG: 3-deoxy-D-manno-octulosonic-acid transferase [Candidatus Electronema aureum]|uniref:3-deoxy-D-manno-octulosonic acid transferase n=1 Tax=Candidatus Electronema aureum TaxID=2005002 RepID=A0A521FZ00_9BACT|nr:MAG: 3-deoxy-D-manno-octulosonic-acid transferase [Candidatus Electronema aureum]